MNKPANEHYHSVYIESSFFETYGFWDNHQSGSGISNATKSTAEYKFLLKKLNKYISEKQSPILQKNADKLISDYEKQGVLPTYQTEWENKYRRPELTQTIKILYQAEPKLFISLNLDQKKTFVRLLDLLLDTGERQAIFAILEEVIQLEPAQRMQLADQFQYTKLNHISDTIKLLTDRFNVYYKLKDLVFNENLQANEVHHLQHLIEEHYWIFW